MEKEIVEIRKAELLGEIIAARDDIERLAKEIGELPRAAESCTAEQRAQFDDICSFDEWIAHRLMSYYALLRAALEPPQKAADAYQAVAVEEYALQEPPEAPPEQ